MILRDSEFARSIIFFGLCAVIGSAGLAFDLSQPLGVAGGIPYVLLVLPGIFARKYWVVAVLALTATILTGIGYELSSPGAPLSIVLLNRGLAILAIWSVAAAVAIAIAQHSQLELQTQIDPLTNCFNRKYLVTMLKREIKVWKREQRPLSLIMLDVDHFKTVNDTFGHQAGDRVLRQLAQTCVANLRGLDRVCRYGGEEFAIVLPGADRKTAGEVAERLRQAVREFHFLRNQEFEVTISLGVAEMTASCRDADGLVLAADKALYSAKTAGRNRVEFGDSRKLIKFRPRRSGNETSLA